MARRPVHPVIRTRRRMILWSLPVVLLGVLASLKLISMPAQAQSAIDSFRDGYYEASAESAGNLLFLNWVERWIPYFDRGTANASGGAFTPATDDLSIALELAPEEQKCMVRVNLARAWEQQGDYYFQAGYFQGAVLLYQTAQAVIDEGEEAGCFESQDQQEEQQDGATPPPTGDGQEQGDPQDGDGQADDGQVTVPDGVTPHRDPGENLEEADRRTEEKIREAERQRDQQEDTGQQDGSSGSGEDPSDPQQDAIDRLREQGDDAEQEKQNEDAEQRGQENDRGYVEKPW